MYGFLTVVGPTTHGLLRNLLSLPASTSKRLVELIGILNGHYDLVPSEIVERFWCCFVTQDFRWCLNNSFCMPAVYCC